MQLLSNIIRTGNLNKALDWGITKDDFLTLEERTWFEELLGYKTATGAIIGPNLLAQKYPSFPLCDDGPQVTTEALCHEARMVRLRMESKKAAEDLAKNADIDPITAIGSCQSTIARLQQLTTPRTVDVHFADAIDQICDDYEALEAGRYMPKGLWPWVVMNEHTNGYEEEDYIVIYGRPKSKKSWVLSYMMAHAYECGKKILAYTKEMTPKNIYRRVAACSCLLPYSELRRAKLDPSQRANLFYMKQYLHQLRESQTFVCLSGKDVARGADTVSWLRAKVELYKPDLIFIDGLYLMAPEGVSKRAANWERMMSVSRDTRQMILDTRTPVIATMQANRKAAANNDANLDEIAFSDAISQDATIIARCIADKFENTISLIFGGSREFALHGLRIGGEPAVDFTFKEILNASQAQKAAANDTDEDEGPKATTKKIRAKASANGTSYAVNGGRHELSPEESSTITKAVNAVI